MGETQLAPESSAPRRRSVVPYFGMLVVWFCLLAWLVFSAANPVTVNLRQLAACTSIVKVRVEDPALGKCSLLETMDGRPVVGELLISNLHETVAQAGQEYIIPISEKQGQWEVTHLEKTKLFPAEVPPLIYPANAATERQLATALETLSRRI